MKKFKNNISILRAFLGVFRHSASKWTATTFLSLSLACGLLCGSCGQIKYIPVETATQVEIKDSTVVHIKDSVRITERSRWKEYGGLLDTLRIRGNHANAKAYIDTTRNILNGELEEDAAEQHTQVVYRDRWKVRDSLVFRDVPISVEVERKIVPKWCWWSASVNLLFFLVFGFLIYKKFSVN